MSIDLFRSQDRSAAVRPRVFVSYHHKGDQWYYDTFSSLFHDSYETIYDNSLERVVESDNVDYVMRSIRENHISGTSCTVVLVGAATWGRKYVDWEIKATLDKNHGLIGVCLPTTSTSAGGGIMVPPRLNDNILSKFALWVSWTDLTSSAARLGGYIAEARSRNTQLINNARERRLRNA
jgi:hypothetical protein